MACDSWRRCRCHRAAAGVRGIRHDYHRRVTDRGLAGRWRSHGLRSEEEDSLLQEASGRRRSQQGDSLIAGNQIG